MADSPDFERELQALSAELRKLEGEYNMYFAGRTPRPPIESRGRVDQLFKQWDRRSMDTPSMRFRHQTLQSRYSSLVDLWDRALRAREEGRSSPLFKIRERASTTPPPTQPAAVVADSVPPATPAIAEHPSAVTFTDPRKEHDKLQTLYDVLMDARKRAGESSIPFQKFADLVNEQTQRLKKKGLGEVTFSVTTTDGRVNLTAKGSKPTS